MAIVGYILSCFDVSVDKEKRLYFYTMAPPFVFAIYIYVLMRRNPRTLIKSLTTIVPGLQHEKGHSEQMVKFWLRADADLQSLLLFFQVHKEEMERLQKEVRRLGRLPRLGSSMGLGRQNVPALQPQPEPMGSVVDDGTSEKTMRTEILVNHRHFAMLSFVPALFLAIYFWDAAVLSREVSTDFPLMHCLNGDECFYIDTEYYFWSYPHYKPLDCEGMRVDTAKGTFSFAEPKEAQFYKCYTWVVRDGLQNLIQGLADSIALTAVSVIAILYFCVEFTNADSENVEELTRQRRCCVFKQVALLIVGVGYIMWVAHVYGTVNNEFVGYLSLPGLCTFFFILLYCRQELLTERIMNLDQQEPLSRESTSSESDGMV
mmetsp:Transcript_90719/g.211052  ORF Transcript_90719/g.211052 Transcript_90719/m.211052 type:complete len:374 (-) Transcript_90719:124-1245(-)